MVDANTAAQAAGEAARLEAENQTRAVIENVNDDAARALVAAQEEIDRANAASAQIAQAAMATELGQRIASNEQRDSEWRTQMEARTTETQSALQQVTNLLQSLASPPVPVSSSSPPTLPDEPIPVVVVPPTNQNVVAENPAPQTNHEPPRPKKIRL